MGCTAERCGHRSRTPDLLPPWRRQALFFALVVAALCLLCAPAARAAATLYVDAFTGNDACDGLAVAHAGAHGPKATIQAAIGASAPGDAVVVLPGTYLETVRLPAGDLLLTSIAPGDPATVAATLIAGDPATPWARVGILAELGQGPGTVVTGLTVATGTGRGIECRNDSSPTFHSIVVRDNAGNPQCLGGGIACTDSSPVIRNALVWGNASRDGCAGVTLIRSSPQLLHCTIADNTASGTTNATGSGLACTDSSPLLRHCIVWGNSDSARPDGPQIAVLGGGLPVIQYSCVQGGRTTGAPGALWVPGCLDANPLFAAAAGGDFRLMSAAGRWTGTEWTNDPVTSPCVDAGDPADDASAEPLPNGGRLNLGFDGGTPLASRSPETAPAITIEPSRLQLNEGGSTTFTVSLARTHTTPLPVTLYLDPPVRELTIAPGQAFVLDPANGPTAQPATLSACEDDADTASALTWLWIEAQGLAPLRVPVALADDDVTLTVAGGYPAGVTIHERGSLVALTAQPLEHWHFATWQGDTRGMADPSAPATTILLDAPASVVAQAAIDRHSLVLISPLGDPRGAGEYDHGALASWAVTSPASGAAGQRFVAQPPSGTVLMDADRTVAVNWWTEFQLVAAANGPGVVRPAGSTWHRDGSTATLSARPTVGFCFAGWQGDIPLASRLQNPLDLALDGPRTVQARFGTVPVQTWAAVTVDRPLRPGAAAPWLPVSLDPAGGWQSDLSIVVPQRAPVVSLAWFRARPHDAPGETVGGDFREDTPGRPPQDWLSCPQQPNQRCLVAALRPPFGDCARALRLTGTDSGPQGLSAPSSAIPGDADAQLALLLPASPPPGVVLAEFWCQGVGLRLRTDPAASVRMEIESNGVAQPVDPTPALQPGQWNVIGFFLWSRTDGDADGLDDGWELGLLGDLTQTPGDDPDADGLDNGTEYALGTNPVSPDSDADGMPDAWERSAQLDPLAPDAAADPDGDLLPNGLEAQLGTDAQRPDLPAALFAATHRLAAFWPLAESLEDRGPMALHMTPRGEASAAGGALALLGTGGAERRDLPASLANASRRTLSVWFRSDPGGPLIAASAQDPCAASLSTDSAGHLTAVVQGTDMDAAPAAWQSTADSPDPTAWHLVALVCPDAGVPVLYLDGEPTPTASSAAASLAALAPWPDLLLGVPPVSDRATATFSGSVSALALFTEALPAMAVRQLFQAGRGLPLHTLRGLDLDADSLPDSWELACFGNLAQGPQDDADGDGLADGIEFCKGCDPLNPDTDGDGLTDGTEVCQLGTSPTAQDTDGDGLADSTEVRDTASDPLLADTDGDGLPDGFELALGLSPRNPDTDGDGTNDALADPDGDGATNGQELARGTDPQSSDLGPPSVSFATAATPVSEADAVVTVTILLDEAPPPGQTVTLRVVTAGGTATLGSDVEFADTPLELGPTCLSATVQLRLRADGTPEPTETTVLALTQVRGARLGPQQTHTIVIADAVSPADDTDADGLPDAWEMRFFGSLSESAVGDPDHDGLTNLAEFRSGARPDKPYRTAAASELGLRVTGLSH